jgi:hypothetical protein
MPAITAALSAICDLLHPGRLQAVHELDLVGGGDRLLLVLQPVARADIDERHVGGELHGSMIASRWSTQAGDGDSATARQQSRP